MPLSAWWWIFRCNTRNLLIITISTHWEWLHVWCKHYLKICIKQVPRISSSTTKGFSDNSLKTCLARTEYLATVQCKVSNEWSQIQPVIKQTEKGQLRLPTEKEEGTRFLAKVTLQCHKNITKVNLTLKNATGAGLRNKFCRAFLPHGNLPSYPWFQPLISRLCWYQITGESRITGASG